MPRHLRRQRRDRTSGPRRIAVPRAQVSANRRLQVAPADRLLDRLMPSLKRPHESFPEQRLLRTEVRVEGADRQTGLLHDLREANGGDATLPEETRRRLED